MENFERVAKKQFNFQGIEPGNDGGVFIQDIGLNHD